MSQQRKSDREVAEIVRLLAPLARSEAELPPADVVYWRAQARLALEQAERARREALLPLRIFHVTIGVGAIAVAGLVAAWPLFLAAPPGAGLFTAPLLMVLVAAGTWLLAEAEPAG